MRADENQDEWVSNARGHAVSSDCSGIAALSVRVSTCTWYAEAALNTESGVVSAAAVNDGTLAAVQSCVARVLAEAAMAVA